MHMILANNTKQDLNLKMRAGLPYLLSHPLSKAALQQITTIFRDPNKMVLNLIFGVTSLTMFHDQRL